MNYKKCTLDELTKFAASRNVLPFYASAKHINRRRAGYIAALRAADRQPSAGFRFLDLSPELRNRVYNELLVLHDSYTCHPEILATCKQINREATGILYGNNLIEVRLYHDGVYVHGRRCGPLHDHGTIHWPDMLRRAQFVHFCFPQESLESVDEDDNIDYLYVHVLRAQVTDRAFYSLCVFLMIGNALLSLTIDLTYTDPFDSTSHSTSADLYPYRLLGIHRPQLVVTNRLEFGEVFSHRLSNVDSPILLSFRKIKTRTSQALSQLCEIVRKLEEHDPDLFALGDQAEAFESMEACLLDLKSGLAVDDGRDHEALCRIDRTFRLRCKFVDFTNCSQAQTIHLALQDFLNCGIDYTAFLRAATDGNPGIEMTEHFACQKFSARM